MAKSFMLAMEGFEKGVFDENIEGRNNIEAITAAAKAAIVIDGAFFENDVDITPYIGSMPDVFTDSYDEDEFLDVCRIPLEKAAEMVLSGEIKDAKTQTAVLKVKLLRDKGVI